MAIVYKTITLNFGADFEYSLDNGITWLTGAANTDYDVAPIEDGSGKVKVRSVNSITNIPVKANTQSNIKSVNIRNGSTLTTLASAFKDFPALEKFRMSNMPLLTSMYHTLHSCSTIRAKDVHFDGALPLLTNVNGLFYGSSLDFVPSIDLSNVSDMSHWCRGTPIRYLPDLDYSSVTLATYAFAYTPNLKYVPDISIELTSIFSYLFTDSSDSRTEYIGVLSLNKASDMRDLFSGRRNLIACGLSLNRVEANIQNLNAYSTNNMYFNTPNLKRPYAELVTNLSSIETGSMFVGISDNLEYPSQYEKDQLDIDQTYSSDHSNDWLPYILLLSEHNNPNVIGCNSISLQDSSYVAYKDGTYQKGNIHGYVEDLTLGATTPTTTTTNRVEIYDTNKLIEISGTSLNTYSDIAGSTLVSTVNTGASIKSIYIDKANTYVYVLTGSINTNVVADVNPLQQTLKRFLISDLSEDVGFGVKNITNPLLSEVQNIILEGDLSPVKMIRSKYAINGSALVVSSTEISTYSDISMSTKTSSELLSFWYNTISRHNVIGDGYVLSNTIDGNVITVVLPDRV